MVRSLALSIGLSLVLASGVAEARAEKTLAYQREAAWPTAVRFIRVDENLKIVEKDADAGYVLFELKEEGKIFRGSLEVMTVVVDGRTLIRFVMQIGDRPSWVEIAMLTRLERKLRTELGAPAPAPTKPRKPDEPGGPGPGTDRPKAKDEPHPGDPPRPDEGGPPVSPTP